MLATLCLNEMQWLPKLYEQHKDWPGLTKWVFVESADVAYAEAHPELVSKYGLSVDGTSQWLQDLAHKDKRVVVIPFGFSRHPDIAQGKATCRNEYLKVANTVKPDWIVVMDADEFVTKPDQVQMNAVMNATERNASAICFYMRTIWRPESIKDQLLFNLEAIGGVWSLAHCRVWRFYTGMKYQQNHNWPETETGVLLNANMRRYDRQYQSPAHIHMGFASLQHLRKAKTDYYATRGEGKIDHRREYMDCRRAFETWKPGDELPYLGSLKAKIIPYTGPIPECFQ